MLIGSRQIKQPWLRLYSWSSHALQNLWWSHGTSVMCSVTRHTRQFSQLSGDRCTAVEYCITGCRPTASSGCCCCCSEVLLEQLHHQMCCHCWAWLCSYGQCSFHYRVLHNASDLVCKLTIPVRFSCPTSIHPAIQHQDTMQRIKSTHRPRGM